MKKITLIILVLSLLLSLFSCGGTEYEPVPSTNEESETVMTLSLDGDTYEVKYELYRALFLNYKDAVSGGDDSVWTGDGKDEYIEKIENIILERAASIYAAFAICKNIGFDVYSNGVEKKINQYIKESVEGGDSAEGYGSYEKYLEVLRSMNLNYSVQTLLYRYAIATEAIDNHYIGTLSADDINGSISVGSLKYTREDVKSYYESNECVRVLRAHIQASAHYDPLEYANRVKSNMEDAAINGEDDVATVIINSGLTAPTEVSNGYLIGKHNLDSFYFEDMTKAAFELSKNEVSSVIDINNGEERILYILYKAEKSDEHFEHCYNEIAYVYLTDTVGEIIDHAKDALYESAVYSDFLKSLDRSTVSME